MMVISETTTGTTIGSSKVWKMMGGLQFRIAMSYVWVTVASLLLLELLVYGVLAANVTVLSDYSQLLFLAQRPAQQYAQAIAQQTPGTILPAHAASVVSHPEKLFILSDQPAPQNATIVPVVTTRLDERKPVSFVLLIAPDGSVLDSSYLPRYPIGQQSSQLLPARASSIHDALAGKMERAIETAATGHIAYVAQPIWKGNHLLGAIYLQIPLALSGMPDIIRISLLFLASAGILILLVVPLGTIFGIVTTRALVLRLRRLIAVTGQFAAGNYAQRLPITRKDEVGQLEGQMNSMAEQLAESIAQRELLSEQNARLAERARISRELHDAVSQDLFSIRTAARGLQTALVNNPVASVLQPYVGILQEAADSMVREMRALLLELRPLQLENLGLRAALEELAAIYRNRLGITIATSISLVQLEQRTEHVLFRCVQEALTNAARHAEATVVSLGLEVKSRMVTCTITDNGNGFSSAESGGQRGLGLMLMQERVRELGGTFVLHSAPGEGTRVCICLPLDKSDD
jgi:two-component system, NarL family, sensor histidine kinase LiaS